MPSTRPGAGPTATALDERIAGLIAAQPEGSALLREFYSDPAIFARDIERIHLRRWLCAGHESRIPRAGDYFVFELGGESVIVVRGRDGRVRALLNVCRHRGSQVCYEREGNAKVFVCPYHAWSYDLEGRLKSARQMGKDFDKSTYRLKAIHARVVAGLVFVCFADDPPGLDDATRVLGASLGRYGWADARIAARAVYSVEANWKLATENYVECYHCAPAHPEFSRGHATESPAAETEALRAAAGARARAMGIDIPALDRWAVRGEDAEEGVDCYHDAAYPGHLTGSEDGRALAPLMGDFTDFDGGFTYVDVGPASFFLAYPDHGVIYLFIPRAAQRTDMEINWLVRADAREGEDYERERLTWLWDVTTREDKRIIDHNQRGVNSRFYAPGPYAPMESTTRRFTEWYLARIG